MLVNTASHLCELSLRIGKSTRKRQFHCDFFFLIDSDVIRLTKKNWLVARCKKSAWFALFLMVRKIIYLKCKMFIKFVFDNKLI